MTFIRPSLSTKEIIEVEPRKVSPRFALPVGVEGAPPEEQPDSGENEGAPIPGLSDYFETATGLRVKSQKVVVRNGQVSVDVVIEFTPAPGQEEYELRITRA